MATRKPKAAQTEESALTTVFKPHGEEFALDPDFTGIAAALNLPVEDVEFTIEESAEGKTLSGKPKA